MRDTCPDREAIATLCLAGMLARAYPGPHCETSEREPEVFAREAVRYADALLSKLHPQEPEAA